ncbi:hypothetical protein TRICI_006696 [Trichomonascus ciferrii]|uniref:Uncharacterized protein n=1 Tax=Trichomonascus ciferrii TaxID=44093 RepID=A0A642UEX8_9ASCO|nr:hypothetical protein TRICI_006696 [Trichomonascus ciferrii]
MGSKLSKGVSQGGKRLSKTVVDQATKDVRPAQTTHQVNVPDPNKPMAEQEKNETVMKDGQDPQFAERLKQLGQVQYKDIPTHYKRDNDLLSAVRAREELQKQQPADDQPIDQTKPKSQTHPATIASILQSRKEGEKDEQLQVDYNLDPQFLKTLGNRFSIPDFAIEKTDKQKQDKQKEDDVRSLYQPEHGGKKPNLEEIRPKKKFFEKTLEI